MKAQAHSVADPGLQAFQGRDNDASPPTQCSTQAMHVEAQQRTPRDNCKSHTEPAEQQLCRVVPRRQQSVASNSPVLVNNVRSDIDAKPQVKLTKACDIQIDMVTTVIKSNNILPIKEQHYTVSSDSDTGRVRGPKITWHTPFVSAFCTTRHDDVWTATPTLTVLAKATNNSYEPVREERGTLQPTNIIFDNSYAPSRHHHVAANS